MGEPLGAQLSHRPPGSAPGSSCRWFPPAGELLFYFFFLGGGFTHQYLGQVFRLGEKIS